MAKLNKYYIYSIAAMLSGLSLLFQLMPFWPTSWGMRIDIVAVPWIIALFMFGWRASLLTTGISFILIGFIAASSWLGAGMKALATLTLLVPLYFSYDVRKKRLHYFWLFFMFGLVLRSVAMIYVNYYFALPIWLHMSSSEIIAEFPWYFIVIPNVVQGAIEVLIAYLVVFKTKLRNYIMRF